MQGRRESEDVHIFFPSGKRGAERVEPQGETVPRYLPINEVYRGNNTKTDSGEIHSKTSRYTSYA